MCGFNIYINYISHLTSTHYSMLRVCVYNEVYNHSPPIAIKSMAPTA